jgi:hypothetical protein
MFVSTEDDSPEDAALEMSTVFLPSGAAVIRLQTSFRYHHLISEMLRAELHARDPARGQELQPRAAQWFHAEGDTRGGNSGWSLAPRPSNARSTGACCEVASGNGSAET